MRVLDVANQCCYRTGDNPLNALFSTDDNARSWLGYLQQAGRLITKEHGWQKLRRDAVITTSGNKAEYDLPSDFMDMKSYFIYNITDNRYIPLESDDEAFSKQARKTQSQSSIRFRMMNDKIVFTYPIEDGLTLKYSYQTKYICKNINTDICSEMFMSDDDEFLLSNELLILKAISLRALDLGLPEADRREMDYQKFLAMEMADDGGMVKFNRYFKGFVNKTTPVEYSAYDNY